MRRAFLASSLLIAAACGSPALTSASASPAASSAAPAPTPTPVPTASPTARPTGTPVPMPSFALVDAPSRTTVWVLVAGSRLFRSSDGGTTWNERAVPGSPAGGGSLPTPIQSMSFLDDREGWILSADQPATQCQQQRSELWHTTDGAATWTALKATGIAFAQCKRLLAFGDAQRGVLVTYDPAAAPTVYRTADGGATWTAGKIPDPRDRVPTGSGADALRPVQVRWIGSTALFDVITDAATLAHRVYRSTDGGATWTASPAFQQDVSLALVTPTRWLQISLPESSTETTDGGATWHPFETDYRQAAPVAPAIVFGDASVGYATVRGGLSRTTDGGAHWTAIATPGT